MKKFQVWANAAVFGIFPAEDEQAARDACARDAGYVSEEDMAEQLGAPSELVASVATILSREQALALVEEESEDLAPRLNSEGEKILKEWLEQKSNDPEAELAVSTAGALKSKRPQGMHTGTMAQCTSSCGQQRPAAGTPSYSASPGARSTGCCNLPNPARRGFSCLRPDGHFSFYGAALGIAPGRGCSSNYQVVMLAVGPV
jgi:hypothetical protein